MPEPINQNPSPPVASTPAPATSPQPSQAPSTPTPSAPQQQGAPATSLREQLAAGIEALNGATGATTPPPQSAPPAQVAGAVTAPSAVGTPGQPAPAQPVAAPAAPAVSSMSPAAFNEFCQELGINAENWTPAKLFPQLQQTIQFAQTADAELRQLRQQVAQFQQAPPPAAAVQPAAPAAPKKWYEQKVEYDANWDRQIVEDAEGNLSVVRGADPSIIQKRDAFLRHRVDVMNRFAQDPAGTIEELITEQVKKTALETSQGTVQQFQQQAAAQQIMARNQEWMFNSNNFTGQKTLTPAGQSYKQYATMLNQANPQMADEQIDTMAKKLVFADMQMQQIQQPPAPAAPAVPAAAPQPMAFGQPIQQGQQWAPQPFGPAAPPPAPSNGFTQLTNVQPGVNASFQVVPQFGDALRQVLTANGYG